MRFDKPEQVAESIRDQRSTAQVQRNSLAIENGVYACYFSGIQWLQDHRETYLINSTTLGRKWDNHKLDGGKSLRVTMNRVTRHVVKAWNATWPNQIFLDVAPGGADGSPSGLYQAQCLEELVNAGIDTSCYVSVRQDANARRAMFGTYGVGLALETQMRTVQLRGKSVEMPDRVLRAFHFEPHKLTLDPAIQERDLENHDYIIYTEAMTAARIKRVYGVEFDEDELRTIGELSQTEQRLNQLSGGLLYRDWKRYSKTKGALVHQYHIKGDTGRHEKMFVVIQTTDEDLKVVNWENQDTPFGGRGLPLALIHGHRRPESMWSIGDVAMLRDDQDRLNLLASMWYRQVHRNAGYQVKMARESLRGGTEEDARNQINNQVGGVLFYNAGRHGERIPAPEIMQYPPPQPVIADAMQTAQREFQDQTFRSDLNFGKAKTHIPDRTNERALEESDEVMGIRAEEDRKTDERLLRVMLGTMIRSVKSGAPTTLGDLRLRGFDLQKLSIIQSADDTNTPVRITVRRESTRYRSTAEKRRDLDNSLQYGMDMETYRDILATSEHDSPLAPDDRLFTRESTKNAMNVAAGEQWRPIPMGRYSRTQISAFQRAMMDTNIKSDPQAMARLSVAVVDQTRMMVQESLNSDPSYVMQQEAARQEAQMQAQQAPQEQGMPADASMTLGQLMESASSGGQPQVAAQPV